MPNRCGIKSIRCPTVVQYIYLSLDLLFHPLCCLRALPFFSACRSAFSSSEFRSNVCRRLLEIRRTMNSFNNTSLSLFLSYSFSFEIKQRMDKVGEAFLLNRIAGSRLRGAISKFPFSRDALDKFLVRSQSIFATKKEKKKKERRKTKYLTTSDKRSSINFSTAVCLYSIYNIIYDNH